MNIPGPNDPISKWADYLSSLLDSAIESSGKNDVKAMQSLKVDLKEFVDNSPAGAGALDAVARETIAALAIADAKLRLNELVERSHEFAELEQLIAAATPNPAKSPKNA
jgi:hypothetical protein